MNPQPKPIDLLLSDGTVVLVEVSGSPYDGPVSVQTMQIAAEKAFKAISSLAADMKTALNKAKPDKATVEFSIEFEKKGDDILTKICNVSGKGGLKVTLEWEFKDKT